MTLVRAAQAWFAMLALHAGTVAALAGDAAADR
jgi:hypothetical protein